MPPQAILPTLILYIHILTACIAIGGPFFVRFALLPAATKVLDDATHQKLRETINARWKHFVYLIILVFILTGLYQFLVEVRVDGHLINARWKDFGPDDKKTYHMLFGIKMLAAFAMFFLASALAGRTKTFAPIRKNAKVFLGLFLLLALVAVFCAVMMNHLPYHPLAGIVPGGTL